MTDTTNPTQTWAATADLIAALVRHGDSAGQELALEEVRRMATALDAAQGAYHSIHTGDAETAELPQSDAVPIHLRRNYISEDVPPHHDTVLGFIAKRFPGALAHGMCEEPCATSDDGVRLRRKAKQRGIEFHKVPAPAVLRDRGIEQVNAYPVALLAEVLK